MKQSHSATAGISLLGLVAGFVLVGSTTLAHGEEGETRRASREFPPGELGRVVRLGQELVEKTGEHPLSKPYVGNALSCSSCHLDAGTDPQAASFLGVATAYPAWSPREKAVITLEDRVANCFLRSMNGKRPTNGGEVSVAIATYITWLSQGEPLAMNAEAPLGPRRVPPLTIDPAKADVERGRAIFANQCADCHGEAGQGTDEGAPVWGDRSFNDGAGMAGNDKLAAWLKVAMPLGDPSLSEQEALDVAAFVNSHPRPRFVPEAPPEAERGVANGGDR